MGLLYRLRFAQLVRMGTILGLALSLVPATSRAQVLGPLGLQTGGVGDGYVFSSVSVQEWQSRFGYKQNFGAMSFAEISGEKMTSRLRQNYWHNAYSYRAGPHFYIVGFADMNKTKVDQTMRHSTWRLSSNGSVYTLGSRVVIDRQRVVLSATIGLKVQNEESRELAAQNIKLISKRSRMLLPHHAVGLGWKFSNATVLSQLWLGKIGSRVFSGSVSGLNGASNDGAGEGAVISQDDVFDESYQSPWRAGIHVLMDLDSEFQLAASMNYMAGSVTIDDYQWSHMLTANGNRELSERDIQDSSWNFSGGMRYYAQADLSVSLSMSYTTPSYTEERYAAFELDNLGGFETGFDVEFVTHNRWRWALGTSYQYPFQLHQNYEYTESEVLKHQRIPIAEGSQSTMTQNSFGLVFSVAYIPQHHSTSSPDENI